MDHTKTTISQHYSWPDLREDIRTHIRVFNTCNRNNKQTANKAEAIPWDRLLVNPIGPYKIGIECPDDPLVLKLQ